MADKRKANDISSTPKQGSPPNWVTKRDDDTFGESRDAAQSSQSSIKNRTSSLVPEITGYRIKRKLGQGGMGAVFLAVDETLNREVAIKVVSYKYRESSELRERFEQEIQTVASLQHSFIAQLHSAGHCEGLPYFVMEYVDGPTLDEHSKEPLVPKRAATLVAQLCEAVTYCHDKGVLHRDLKPANVLLTKNLQPKIADFGVAKAIGQDTSTTRTGDVLGTPGYMAPEQAGGSDNSLTTACDVYALGAILYRLLTGRPPFAAVQAIQTVLMVVSNDPVNPRKLVNGIPTELETICLKCLEKEPGRRYESATALRDDLQRFLDDRPILARPIGPFKKITKWTRRNPATALFVFGLVAAAIAVPAALVWHNALLSKQLQRSNRLAEHGSSLSNWIAENHLPELNRISGTTQARHDIVERVKQYLDESYNDMPSDPKYTRRLGRSFAQLATIVGGMSQNSMGDFRGAEINLLKAIELYDRVLAKEPDSSETLHLKIDALFSLSVVYRELLEPDACHDSFHSATRLLNALPSDNPRAQFLRTQALDFEIEQLIAENDFQSALQLLDELDELILKSENTEFDPVELTNQKIWSLGNRGLCLENLGRLDEAVDSLGKMVSLAKAGVDADPTNPLELQRYATSLVRLADVRFSQTDAEVALAGYQQALEISAKLADLDPESADAKLRLASKMSRVASVFGYLQRFEEAEQSITKAIEIHRELNKEGKSSLTSKRSMCVYIQQLANQYSVQGKFDESRKSFDEHSTICHEILKIEPYSIGDLNQLAEAQHSFALMLTSAWIQNDIDPKTVRNNPQYLEIVDCLERCLKYFEQIEDLSELNYHQDNFHKKVFETQTMIEDMVQKLEATQKNVF